MAISKKFTGRAADKVGSRMIHLGVAALLARKGVTTSFNKGIPVKYNWRKIGKGKGNANSFRLQPFANRNDWGPGAEDPQYMRLRNFSYNVFKEDWSSSFSTSSDRKRPGETERERAARHLWTGAYPGGDMKDYRIKGSQGSEDLMELTKYNLQEAGMEGKLRILTWELIRHFVKVAGEAGTWSEVIKRTGHYRPVGGGKAGEVTYTGVGGGQNLKFVKTTRGGLPMIGAQSTEEAQFYLMNAVIQEGIESAMTGKEVDVGLGLTKASLQKYVRHPGKHRLDIHKERQKAIYAKTMHYLMELERKGTLDWGKRRMENWQIKMEGIDVGEQPLEVRFKKHWEMYRKEEKIDAIKNYKQLEGFISFLSKKAGKFTVKNAPTGKAAEKARVGRDDMGQFARALKKEGTYLFTQPLESDGRMVMIVHEVAGVPTFIPAYIKGENVPLGTAMMRRLAGEENEAKITATLKKLSDRGYAVFNSVGLQITESIAQETFYYGSSRYGDVTPMVTMVSPPSLARWTKQWIDNAAEQWWSDSSMGWDNVFSPSQMQGARFARWWQYWVERSKKAAYGIDIASGQQGWKTWLRSTVTPKYMRGEEGGRRPTKKGSGMMMPYAQEPRTWHSPLYARPYFIQDSWGKKQVAAAERGGYTRFMEEKQGYTTGSWRGKAQGMTTGGMVLSDW